MLVKLSILFSYTQTFTESRDFDRLDLGDGVSNLGEAETNRSRADDRNGHSYDKDRFSHAGRPGYFELGEDGKRDQNVAMNVIEAKTAVDIKPQLGL